jgi:tetratricopeptide (TPR) repeat protein
VVDRDRPPKRLAPPASPHVIQAFRSIALTCFLLLPGAARATAAPEREAIEQARALAAKQTVESRAEALSILEQVRPECWENPIYHLLLARIYEDGERFDDARRAYVQVLKIRPRHMEAMVSASRLTTRSFLNGYDRLHLVDTIDLLERSLRVGPDSVDTESIENPGYAALRREALYLHSMCLCLRRHMGGFDPGEFVREAKGALTDTDELVGGSPADPAVLRMHAVNCFDAGRSDEADRVFRRALEAMPDSDRAQFQMPNLLRFDRSFSQLGARERAKRVQSYWDGQDPTSMNLVNERQLRFWVNTTIAMFYQPQPWKSGVGRAIMLMGPPDTGFSHGFGGIELGFSNGVKIYASRFSPAQPYQLDGSSDSLVRHLSAAGPPVLETRPDAQSLPLIATGASFPDSSATPGTIVRCVAASPLPGRLTSTEGLAIALSLRDSDGRQVGELRRLLTAGDLHELAPEILPGMTDILVGWNFRHVPAGRYTLDAEMKGDAGAVLGTRRIQISVKPFGLGLQVSDLEPFIPKSERWKDVVWEGRPYQPTVPMVPRNAEVDWYYVITGLKESAGRVEYVSTHIVARFDAFRDDLRAAARIGGQSGEDARFGEIDQVFSRMSVDSLRYRHYRFEPVRVNVSRRTGTPIRAVAVTDGAAFSPGRYVLIIKVEDRLAAAGTRTTSYAAAPFQVVEPEEYRSLLGSD